MITRRMSVSNRSGLPAIITMLIMVPLSAKCEAVSELRRATIQVASIEAVLPFYTQLLGLQTRYDRIITDPAQLSLIGLPAKRARVVALESPLRPDGGTVGLMQILDPEPGETDDGPARIGLLFLSEDAAGLHARLLAAGVKGLGELQTYSESLGTTRAFTVEDPAGVRVSIAEISGD